MVTKQISVKPLGNYEISQRPRNIKMITSDNLATITAAGYITTTDVQNLGGVFGTDVWEVIYSYDVATDSGTLGYFGTSISSGVVTLDIWENPGNVLLPVVSGNFANFNGTAGQIKDSGYSPTNAAKTKVVMADAATVANHIMVSTDTAGTVGNKTGTAINDGNLQAGRSGVAGALISLPSAAASGSLSLTAVASAGDYAAVISNASFGQASTISIPDPGAATANFLLDSQALANTSINTTGAGKTVRINVRTESTDTANSLIGLQVKPGRGISAATDVIGAEISPRLNDAIALTGSGSVIGLHVDAYLKGTTGNVAGDVRGIQIEMVDDTGSSRTVAGNVTHLRVRSNISYTITGKYTVMRVENEEGTKEMDAFAQFTTGTGALVETNGTVGGAQTIAMKMIIGTTTYYVPFYASVS